MTQETRARSSETVRAIWNQARTLKICMGVEIRQKATKCDRPHNRYGIEGGPIDDCAMGWAWPRHMMISDGPAMVSGDGVAHFCEDCLREIDPDFVADFTEAYNSCGLCFYEEWMDELAAHFPPGKGIIERGPRPVDREKWLAPGQEP